MRRRLKLAIIAVYLLPAFFAIAVYLTARVETALGLAMIAALLFYIFEILFVLTRYVILLVDFIEKNIKSSNRDLRENQGDNNNANKVKIVGEEESS